MGLDLSHGCWHGAYSAFTRWRTKLAEVAGYEIANVEVEPGYKRELVMIDWGHLPKATLKGDWDVLPSDPLMIIIAHSDCDGLIHHEHAGPLADRLAELLPKLPEGGGGGHIQDWREKTQAFIDGLRAAAAAGENVEFG